METSGQNEARPDANDWLKDIDGSIRSALSPIFGDGYAELSSEGYTTKELTDAVKEAVAATDHALPDPTLNKERFLHNIYDLACKGQLDGQPLPEQSHYPLRHEDTNLANEGYMEFALRRAEVVKVYARNPDLGESLVTQQVLGIHASSSGSLLSILENGLKPLDHLRKSGARMASGERYWSGEQVRQAVSFVPLKSTSLNQLGPYLGDNQPMTSDRVTREISQLADSMRKQKKAYGKLIGNPADRFLEMQTIRDFMNQAPSDPAGQLEQQLIAANFPVVYGVKASYLSSANTFIVSSSIRGEFAVKNGVDHEGIGVILVPKAWVNFVQELVNSQGISINVYPIEDIPDIPTNLDA